MEVKPVPAGMVTDPADCRWSSCRANALGVESRFSTRHGEYLARGACEDRYAAYRRLFEPSVERDLADEMRRAADQGMVPGSDRFEAGMEAITGARLRSFVAADRQERKREGCLRNSIGSPTRSRFSTTVGIFYMQAGQIGQVTDCRGWHGGCVRRGHNNCH